MKQVGIIMGSDSDLPIMQDAAKILDSLEVSYEITIVSAHRTPQRMFDYAMQAKKRGIRVIIAGAGGAAHLPGMVASITPLPVIGVPIETKSLSGLDSLYSIVQMPPGIPVATVAINGAHNAGLLAAKILGQGNDALLDRIEKYAQELGSTVLNKADTLEKWGYKEYLNTKKS
jgi:phosphoribosylaminoimidazole carboxylase, PurE protein